MSVYLLFFFLIPSSLFKTIFTFLQLKEQLATLELDIEESVERGREEVREQMKREMKKRLEEEKARYIALAEEKRRVEADLHKERELLIEKSKEDRDVDAMRLAKQRAEVEAERLRKEIDKVHRMWEKKFQILQTSLHALKDEMFVRRYLEKQAAQLHTSAVAFMFGKNALAQQDIPKQVDTTVRSKTMSGVGMSMEDRRMLGKKPGSRNDFDDTAVPFRPPNRGKYVTN